MCQSPVFQTFERKPKILFLLSRNKLILYLQTKEMDVQGELVFYLLLTTYLDWRKDHFINFFSPHFLFDHVFIWNELSKVIWPLWINEFKFIPQTSFLLWWVSFLRASFQLWAFFPPQASSASKRQQCSFLSSLPQVSGLEPPSQLIWLLALLLLLYPPGASDSGLGEQWSSSAWSLHMGLASVRFSGFQCILLQASAMTLLVQCSEGSLGLWVFQGSA